MQSNPCGEIPLSDLKPVVPWVQIQLENMIRVRKGKPPYTPEEIRERHAALEAKPRLTQLQRDIEAENECRHCECSSSDYLCLWCRASVRDTGKL